MAFLKNVLNILTDKRDIKEPVIYKEFNEKSTIITSLSELSDSKDPNIDLKKVDHHLKLFSIGQTGEKSVLFELQHSMLPLVILHDVYLEYEGYAAQLDFVIITHKFIIVLEVKKMFGNIHITDKGEFQRVITKNNRIINKEGFYSPINQVERHAGILEKLLKDTGAIKKCPVTCAVTFANPKTILTMAKNAPANILSSVIRHDQIKTFIQNMLEKNSPVFMTDQLVYKIGDTILKYSKEKEFNKEDYLVHTPSPHAGLTNAAPIPTASNSTHENSLKKSLTQFRMRRSKELNIKPYYIFTNKMLDELLEKKPLTIEKLLEIEGIGQKKAEEFGRDLLAIFNGLLQEKYHTEDAWNVPLEDQDTEEIRSALIAFRTSYSKKLNVKPYYIFTNHTLESILVKRPGTIRDLLNLEGIGPKKAGEFGQELLDTIKGK
ncbi:HRDC domain-containing protein [Bacillus infantis]|uniref:HRDC domain-containing protein n=1 Tax=Bacillus infantis TaxID=324767 RepID=UPI000B9AC9C4|nr:HRDC domain-containing protein [Bacillus infantis]MCK6207046.1 HRDC domain-containing protein [Bacillus infantis]OXT15073.1 helicase [Bacillus sp. OG2]